MAARRDGAAWAADRPDIRIACEAGLSEDEAIDRARVALAGLGIEARPRDRALILASAPWTVWGSPVFHWSLVALVVVIALGQGVRSEGSMAVAVSESKPDTPGSYVGVAYGPLHDWRGVRRAIRVDAFDPSYVHDGIDRGAVPTVSVLEDGVVSVTQPVYPNNMLHTGTLAISVPRVGLAVWFSVLNPAGAPAGRIIQYADFSQEASGGTAPIGAVTRRDAAGRALELLYATVPLDRAGPAYGEWVPRHPTARVVVTDPQGRVLVDRVVRPDEDLVLPGGDTLRLLGVGWYARLSLVDDPTIPLVYGAMIVGLIGSATTLLFRQQCVVATPLSGPEGTVLVVRLRFWRNAPADRDEIEAALRRAVGADEGSEL